MSYDQDLSFNFSLPTRVIFGVNSADDVKIEMKALGGERTLIVTDRGIINAGLLDHVKKTLGDRCVGVFSEVPQDTGIQVINSAAEVARGLHTDSLISLGGGSVIDTAKGLAVLLKEGGRLEDYQGMQMLTRPQTIHICIPTTAGTGSEVTSIAVVKDHRRKQKSILLDYHITPNVAILDPQMVRSLPSKITAFTGIDALTHAIEAIHSLQSEPITDALALHAIRLIIIYLPRCVDNGNDLLCRGQMQIAANIAGVAFSNAMVGMVHAMAHSLGAKYGVPHGLANSILLPHCILYNMDACPDRYAMVAEAMGTRKEGMNDLEASNTLVKAIYDLTKKIGLPQRLRDVHVPKEGLIECAELSLSDGSIVYNPKPIVDAGEVLKVYEEAW